MHGARKGRPKRQAEVNRETPTLSRNLCSFPFLQQIHGDSYQNDRSVAISSGLDS